MKVSHLWKPTYEDYGIRIKLFQIISDELHDEVICYGHDDQA